MSRNLLLTPGPTKLLPEAQEALGRAIIHHRTPQFQENLKEALRQLQARLGAQPPIYQVREVEPWSRIPERRQVLVPFSP